VTPEVEATKPAELERLFHCTHFRLWRLRGQLRFTVGAAGVARVLVCIGGGGYVERRRELYGRKRGCNALAGSGRSLRFSAARCGELVGDCATGLVRREQSGIAGWAGTRIRMKRIQRLKESEKTNRLRSGRDTRRKQISP
jgi:hypothetical protein